MDPTAKKLDPRTLTMDAVKRLAARLRKDTGRPYAIPLYDPETGAWSVRDCVVCYAIEGDCSRHRNG
jgi:hypothetical protein